MLGTVLRQQRRPEDALAQFREAVRLMPTLAEAHLSLGQVLQQQGDQPAAAAAFAEAERLNRRKADAQASTLAVGAARTLLQRGNLAAAGAKLREALALADDNFEAHYELGRLLERLGKRDEARRHFEEAYRLAPYLRPPPGQRAAGTAHPPMPPSRRVDRTP